MANRTQTSETRTSALLPLVYGGTLLLSATLLFSIQPLLGKVLLPLLGGAPSVWNTVMVFFQVMLLGGYAYAHLSFQHFGLKFQPIIHAVLLGIAAWQLPFAIAPDAASGLDGGMLPALWVLLVLAKLIALPIFVLASTAPLLQRWFACTNHTSAGDPYFLYAASNLGSFGALFAYPLLIEPALRLQNQIRFWSIGFWVLAAFILICALLGRIRPGGQQEPQAAATRPQTRIERGTILKWIGLSFVPSSLMLGVTNYITTDVASVPLLWVIPLGLYLFTFIIAFSRHSARAEVSSSRAVPILALAVVFPILVQATEPVWVLVLMHLLFFLFAALQCHLKLAKRRPAAEHLTQFYLWLSVGGVLGGIFNALLAPVLFSSVWEYPLMILVATLIGFPPRGTAPALQPPPIYGGALVVLLAAIGAALITLAAGTGVLAANILAGIFLLLIYFLLHTPVRYVLALGTLLLCTGMFRQTQTGVIERERNFFGVLRVTNDRNKPLRRLYHGTTIHGVQFTIPERRCEPLSYYHADGPIGEIASLFEKTTGLPQKVGLIGLGAGAMICYGKPGQEWTLYEIDPAVVRIAQNTNFFSYLSHCAPVPYKIELGDARLRLRAAQDGQFGLLYVDAFSSDVIPMHLLTVEALKLYKSKLAPGGLLGFHLSSRHFDLEPLVANLGRSVGLHCFASTRGELNQKALDEGGFESNWVILAPDALVPTIVAAHTWRRVSPDPKAPLWTDDFSSLAGVLKF